MGIGTTNYQLNQNQMTQAKPAKTSEILKNSTVLLFLSAFCRYIGPLAKTLKVQRCAISTGRC